MHCPGIKIIVISSIGVYLHNGDNVCRQLELSALQNIPQNNLLKTLFLLFLEAFAAIFCCSRSEPSEDEVSYLGAFGRVDDALDRDLGAAAVVVVPLTSGAVQNSSTGLEVTGSATTSSTSSTSSSLSSSSCWPSCSGLDVTISVQSRVMGGERWTITVLVVSALERLFAGSGSSPASVAMGIEVLD